MPISISDWMSDLAEGIGGKGILACSYGNGNEENLVIEVDKMVAIRDNNLQSLPFAQAEIENIKSTIGGGVELVQNMDKKSFMANAKNYQVLHMAIHSIMNPHMPSTSCLVLSDDEEQEVLFTHELENLDLHADLVCLSSCNSGHWQSCQWGRYE